MWLVAHADFVKFRKFANCSWILSNPTKEQLNEIFYDSDFSNYTVKLNGIKLIKNVSEFDNPFRLWKLTISAVALGKANFEIALFE